MALILSICPLQEVPILFHFRTPWIMLTKAECLLLPAWVMIIRALPFILQPAIMQWPWVLPMLMTADAVHLYGAVEAITGTGFLSVLPVTSFLHYPINQ